MKYIQTSYTVYIYILLCSRFQFPPLSRKLHGPHHSGCGGQWLCASALPERPGERGGWQRNHGVDVPVLPCNLPKTWEGPGSPGAHWKPRFDGDFISHDGSMVLLYMVLYGSHQYTLW